jgi:hypothetical protein
VGVVRQDGENTFTTTSIEVNVDGLGDFGTFVRRELDMNLKPGSDDVIYEHTLGVRFGFANAGHNLRQATQTYHGALVSSTNNLFEYVRTARLITQLINEVAHTYRTVNLTAAGSNHDLDQALSDAMTVVNAANSETNREAYRATGPVSTPPVSPL